MEDSSTTAARTSSRRQWTWVILAFLIVPILALLGLWGLLAYSGSERFRAAVAEAEKTEPAWRLTDLLAGRPSVPSEANSALIVESIAGRLGGTWLSSGGQGLEREGQPPGLFNFYQWINGEYAPNRRLDANESEILHQRLQRHAESIRDARTLAGRPEGRHDFPDVATYIELSGDAMAYARNVRETTKLLQLDAADRCAQGDLEGALQDVLAILNAAHSLTSDPVMVSQLARMAAHQVALDTLERILGQGSPDKDDTLAQIQVSFRRESDNRMLMPAIRGERAGVIDLFDRLSQSELKPAQLFGSPLSQVATRGFSLIPASLFFRYNQAIIMEALTEAEAIAQQPAQEQMGLWDRWETRYRDESRSLLGRQYGAPAFSILAPIRSAADTALRNIALLNVGQLLVTYERYRIAQGNWPETPEALVPRFLDSLPVDPFSGEPIRVVQEETGLVVYTVGEKRENGGTADDPMSFDGERGQWSARLWNLDHRGLLKTVSDVPPSDAKDAS